MVEVVWTIPALNDLERILEYIELDNEEAAHQLGHKVFETTDKLSDFPDLGAKPKELIGTLYKRLVVGPILIYHRKSDGYVYIVHVRRGEKEFKLSDIVENDLGQQDNR